MADGWDQIPQKWRPPQMQGQQQQQQPHPNGNGVVTPEELQAMLEQNQRWQAPPQHGPQYPPQQQPPQPYVAPASRGWEHQGRPQAYPPQPQQQAPRPMPQQQMPPHMQQPPPHMQQQYPPQQMPPQMQQRPMGPPPGAPPQRPPGTNGPGARPGQQQPQRQVEVPATKKKRTAIRILWGLAIVTTVAFLITAAVFLFTYKKG